MYKNTTQKSEVKYSIPKVYRKFRKLVRGYFSGSIDHDYYTNRVETHTAVQTMKFSR